MSNEVENEREATFKWLLSNTFLAENIDQHSTLMVRYVNNVLKPADPAPYLEQLWHSIDPAQQERDRIINLIKEHPYRSGYGFSCECGTFVNYWIHIQNLIEGKTE